MQRARALWHRLELVHAVVYFDDTPRDAFTDAGLRGFWMGYFAGRSAPMGPVGAAVVTAAFFNFHPAMVRRALPDAWTFATPDAVLDARRTSTAAALRHIAPGTDDLAAALAPLLERAIASAPDAGRPLFAANRALEQPDDPVERLWLAATCLREHRGDGHVAALTSLGIDGCEAHVLSAAWKRLPPQMILDSRGWSEDDWAAATDRLRSRGWIDGDGVLTSQGREVREQIEAHTDVLAFAPYRVLGDDVSSVLDGLQPFAEAVVESGVVRFPNPMALPATPDAP